MPTTDLPTPDTVSRAALHLDDGRVITVDAHLVAAGCRAHAKHLAGSIDTLTAHPDRLHAVAADVEHLVVTAQRLTERSSHHDGPLEQRVEHLRRTAEDVNAAEVWTVQALAAPGTTFADGAAVRYVASVGDEVDLVNGTADALHFDRATVETLGDLLNLRAMRTGEPVRFGVHLHRSTPRP